jgi:hypothetical protein
MFLVLMVALVVVFLLETKKDFLLESKRELVLE